jgi:hypothetical protein
MDGFHFDALARSLTTAGLRRRVLTGLAGGTLGIILGFSSLGDVAAKKKPCPPCKKRKKGKCKKKPDGKACVGGTCQSGRCVATAKPLTCEGCAPGKTCLANYSCAKACTTHGECSGATLCSCSVTAENPAASYCRDLGGDCSTTPCSTTAQCPPGQMCAAICGNKCAPVCPN